MTHEPCDLLEEQLRENLPDVIRRVVEDYGLFALQDSPMDAKDFDRHHKAARAGVAHLLSLYKLAAALKTDKAEQPADYDDAMRTARRALAGNHNEGDDDAAEDQL